MIYVLAPNQTVEIFPYSIGDLKRDNPNTSFPRNPSEETLAAYNVFPVVEQPTPDYNPATQDLNQLDPTFVGGQWLQTWQITDASGEQISARIRANADYLAFWDTLMVSTVYASIREQSFVSLVIGYHPDPCRHLDYPSVLVAVRSSRSMPSNARCNYYRRAVSLTNAPNEGRFLRASQGNNNNWLQGIDVTGAKGRAL